MKLLALDPGITTGYAFFEDGTLQETGNLAPEDLSSSILLKYAAYDPMTIRVIVENVPIPTMSEMNRTLLGVVSCIRTLFPHATWIRPTIWKQGPAASMSVPTTWDDQPLTSHQRDAIRIGYYAQIFPEVFQND